MIQMCARKQRLCVQWSLTLVVAHLGGSLEKTRVKVEDVTGVSLTAGGTPQQQGHLTVGDSLLGQIVEDDEGVHAVVTEELAHGAAGVGCQVLQGGGVRGGGRHHNAAKGKTLYVFQVLIASCSLQVSQRNI